MFIYIEMIDSPGVSIYRHQLCEVLVIVCVLSELLHSCVYLLLMWSKRHYLYEYFTFIAPTLFLIVL